MKDLDIENNAQHLYFFRPNSYLTKENQLVEICPPIFTFFGRFIFWVTDLCSKGNESKKIHDMTLETLKAMGEQLDREWPRFHFNGDERFEFFYPGCPVKNRTYRELAEFILNKHPLGQHADIQQQAEILIDKFDNLAFFEKFPPVSKKEIIKCAIDSKKNPEEPSVYQKEIHNLQKTHF